MAFNTSANYLHLRITNEDDLKWVEIISEMLPMTSLCTSIEMSEKSEILRQKLVSLCMAGIEEIHLVVKTKSAMNRFLKLCQEINREERLGLRIHTNLYSNQLENHQN